MTGSMTYSFVDWNSLLIEIENPRYLTSNGISSAYLVTNTKTIVISTSDLLMIKHNFCFLREHTKGAWLDSRDYGEAVVLLLREIMVTEPAVVVVQLLIMVSPIVINSLLQWKLHSQKKDHLAKEKKTLPNCYSLMQSPGSESKVIWSNAILILHQPELRTHDGSVKKKHITWPWCGSSSLLVCSANDFLFLISWTQ